MVDGMEGTLHCVVVQHTRVGSWMISAPLLSSPASVLAAATTVLLLIRHCACQWSQRQAQTTVIRRDIQNSGMICPA